MVVLVATLVVTAVSWTALRDAPYVAPTPDDPSPRPVAAEAARTLDLFAAAVDDGDPDAARALAPAGDDEAGALLADVVDNVAALGLESLSLRYVDEAGGVSAAGAWPAAVEATWRLPEDDAPSRAELQVGLVTAGEQVRIRSFGGAGRTPVWLTGPVTVRRAPGVLVVGRTDDGERVLRLAAAAVPVVRRVLPDWTPRLVVEVPATAAALDDALGAERGTYADVAAVTASADGSSGRGAPVHVYVNPQVFGRLSARRRAGRDEPRGRPRRRGRRAQRPAPVAARGFRRLRRAARRRPSAGDHRRPGRGRGTPRRACLTACPPTRRSTPQGRGSERRTRRPGSPAW